MVKYLMQIKVRSMKDEAGLFALKNKKNPNEELRQLSLLF